MPLFLGQPELGKAGASGGARGIFEFTTRKREAKRDVPLFLVHGHDALLLERVERAGPADSVRKRGESLGYLPFVTRHSNCASSALRVLTRRLLTSPRSAPGRGTSRAQIPLHVHDL